MSSISSPIVVGKNKLEEEHFSSQVESIEPIIDTQCREDHCQLRKLKLLEYKYSVQNKKSLLSKVYHCRSSQRHIRSGEILSRQN